MQHGDHLPALVTLTLAAPLPPQRLALALVGTLRSSEGERTVVHIGVSLDALDVWHLPLRGTADSQGASSYLPPGQYPLPFTVRLPRLPASHSGAFELKYALRVALPGISASAGFDVLAATMPTGPRGVPHSVWVPNGPSSAAARLGEVSGSRAPSPEIRGFGANHVPMAAEIEMGQGSSATTAVGVATMSTLTPILASTSLCPAVPDMSLPSTSIIGPAPGSTRRRPATSRWELRPTIPTSTYSPTSSVPVTLEVVPPADAAHAVLLRFAIVRTERIERVGRSCGCGRATSTRTRTLACSTGYVVIRGNERQRINHSMAFLPPRLGTSSPPSPGAASGPSMARGAHPSSPGYSTSVYLSDLVAQVRFELRITAAFIPLSESAVAAATSIGWHEGVMSPAVDGPEWDDDDVASDTDSDAGWDTARGDSDSECEPAHCSHSPRSDSFETVPHDECDINHAHGHQHNHHHHQPASDDVDVDMLTSPSSPTHSSSSSHTHSSHGHSSAWSRATRSAHRQDLTLPLVVGSVGEPRGAMRSHRWSELCLSLGALVEGEALSCEDGWVVAPPPYGEAIKEAPYVY